MSQYPDFCPNSHILGLRPFLAILPPLKLPKPVGEDIPPPIPRFEGDRHTKPHQARQRALVKHYPQLLWGKIRGHEGQKIRVQPPIQDLKKALGFPGLSLLGSKIIQKQHVGIQGIVEHRLRMILAGEILRHQIEEKRHRPPDHLRHAFFRGREITVNERGHEMAFSRARRPLKPKPKTIRRPPFLDELELALRFLIDREGADGFRQDVFGKPRALEHLPQLLAFPVGGLEALSFLLDGLAFRMHDGLPREATEHRLRKCFRHIWLEFKVGLVFENLAAFRAAILWLFEFVWIDHE